MTCIDLLPVIFTVLCMNTVISQCNNLQTYIVHVDLPSSTVPPGNSQDLVTWYTSFFPESVAISDRPSRIIHTYRKVITGFTAKLSLEELQEIRKMEWFMHARPETVYSTHTTYSPKFLGLSRNHGAWQASNYGQGVIIGVLDSGITPGHPSFNDHGVAQPPAKWKGKCELKCNNKIIGARNFARNAPGPPVDHDGHGTHTASTAAGNFVPGASIFGQANGTASGLAPLAHLAIYKVCENDECLEGDILAAYDAAMEDGVDVLSLSIGKGAKPFYEDTIAVGSFQANLKGIFASASGDNSGPSRFSVSNGAPWMLTVGASTMDREIVATVLLGNREQYDGQSLNQVSKFPPTMLPLVYPSNAAARWCGAGSLNGTNDNVRGKAVLCTRGGNVGRIAKGQTVKDAGGAAMILMNDVANGYSTSADPHVLPAAHVSHVAGEGIKAYLNSTPTPAVVTILFRGTRTGYDVNPMVSSFSSRGPNIVSPGILKPDIIGPGESILAAWPASIDDYRNEKGKTFNMVSGTSMSCPHLSGTAALLKSAHPDWSPAMIRSAVMTSATQTNLNGDRILDERHLPADVFATGAGHVNPSKALDPGLVYDITDSDYISYLCLLYTEIQVRVIVNKKINCHESEYRGVWEEAQLNYPSFAVQLGHDRKKYSRTVTNVGDADSIYHVWIETIPGVNVKVQPEVLSFEKIKENRIYEITFSRHDFSRSETYVQGSISWVSSKHVVRIPVSVHLVNMSKLSRGPS